jgi:hypothetical protein
MVLSNYSIGSIAMHQSKPANPVDGDTYYDATNNRMYAYDSKSSTWRMYQLYNDDKGRIENRKKKIKNLLK